MSRACSDRALARVALAALASPALAQKPVKIGVLTPLSPPGDAAAGQLIVRGAKMAAEEINAKGHPRRAQDGAGDRGRFGTPEKGAAGFRKLATQDGVVAVLGQFHSSVTGAVQDLAEQFKVPIFATQASASAFTEKHLNYSFRTHVIDTDRVASSGTAGSRTRASRRSRCSRRTPTTGWGSSRTPRSSSRPRGRGGAQDDRVRSRGGGPHPAAARDQELEAGPGDQHRGGHPRVPDHQAGRRRRPPARHADAGVLRHAGPARSTGRTWARRATTSRSSCTTTRP